MAAAVGLFSGTPNRTTEFTTDAHRFVVMQCELRPHISSFVIYPSLTTEITCCVLRTLYRFPVDVTKFDIAASSGLVGSRAVGNYRRAQ